MPPVTPSITPGRLLDGRYRVVGDIARGGMGTVYQGWDERLGRPVAIKVLDRPATAPWDEARLTAAVNHPHVVPVYDSGLLPDDRPFLVMEFVAGQTLDQLAPLPLPAALRLTRQVVAALAAAHAAGVVHCDLKPRNVLVDRYGQARLTDFGVATLTATPTGAFVYGSAPYLAPERLRGAPATPRVDLYAAGALLYTLLTGAPPYQAADLPGLLARAEAGAPPSLVGRVAGATPALDALLATALHPDPAQRFPSATALLTALEALERTAAGQGARPAQAASPRAVLTRAQLWVASRRRALAATDWPGLSSRAGTAMRSSLASGADFAGSARSDRRIAWQLTLISLSVLATLLLLFFVVARQRAATAKATVATEAPATVVAPAAPAVTPQRPTSAPTSTVGSAGALTAEVTISDPEPPRSARMTVLGRLARGGVPVPGARMVSTWNFSSGPATCRGGETDADGQATCTLSMSGARVGFPVRVDVYFEYQGQQIHAATTFTPR